MVIPANGYSRQKITKLNYNFFYHYFFINLNFIKYKRLIAPRSVRISNIYDAGFVYIPQGRVTVRHPLREQAVGLKFGIFASTKKPFNYRPKIKKQKR